MCACAHTRTYKIGEVDQKFDKKCKNCHYLEEKKNNFDLKVFDFSCLFFYEKLLFL